jgi:putative ABC transport system permease protein
VNVRLALVLLARESRGARGRMAFFVVCLALGVGAVTGVSALVSAVDRNLRGESRQLIAADLKLSSRADLPEVLDELLAAEEVLATCTTVELASMLAVPGAEGRGRSRLVELKAASPGYPFYGRLETEPPGLTPADLKDDEVLAATELLQSLELEPGQAVLLGGELFRVRGALLSEPDRLEFALTLGPRVFLTEAGLARTELVRFGSRVRTSRLLRLPAGLDARGLEALERRLVAGLGAGDERVSVQTHREAQPNVRRSLQNVERYLGLVALLSLLLGGVGVAQVVRTWIEERTPAVAIQRSLGLRPREILQLYLGHVLLLAILASFIGCCCGWLLPIGAALLAPDLLELKAAATLSPAIFLRGFGLGLCIASVFALGPLTAIYKVSPARVLRAEAVPLQVPRWVRLATLIVLLAGVFLAAWIQAQDAHVGALFTGGLLVLCALLVAGARAAMGLARLLPRESVSPYLRHGLAALARPGAGTTATVVALGLGVHVVASMILVEGRLSRELREGLPDQAPSVFLVDVQPEQWPGIEALLQRHGAQHVASTPVAMARLASIGGRAVRDLAEERSDGGRARWVLTREQRLTWRADLPPTNELLEGAWFADDGRAEVSLEERYARDLGAGLGTQLVFDLQGVPIELLVTSLREVDWASFAINFFLIVEPGVLDEAPHSRLAAARVRPEEEQALQDELVAEFRNVTLLRLRPMLDKIAGILERIALGVRALGAVAVLSGLAILAGAISAGGLRRTREVALLKALGLTRGGVALLLASEYGLIGGVAGLAGAGASYALSFFFLRELLNLEPELPWLGLPLFVGASALLAAACGLASSLRALTVRPAATLR